MKTCFKCRVCKPLSDFYPHPQMADGHLNKCKVCACSDAAIHREAHITNPDWIKNERERCRIKAARHRAAGTSHESSPVVKKRWLLANKLKRKAQGIANNAVRSGELTPPEACEMCSVPSSSLAKHHHDYTRPLAVVWLCSACHGVLHRKHHSIPVTRRKPQTP